MNILYVCTSTDTGGAEVALRRLARAALGAGHRVKILSLKPLGALGLQMQKDGWDVSSLELCGKYHPVQTAGVLARLIQEIQHFRPDVVHALLYRAVQFCRLAKKRVSFKLITTPHYDLSRKNYFLRLLDRALKDWDDISGAESFSTAEFLKKHQKYAEKKVRLVENGVDLTYFKPDEAGRRAARDKWHFAAQDIVFVCVARLAKEKNHKLLLQSFAAVYAKNPFVRLLLVGDGPERENLQNFVQKNGLEKGVIFAGEVSNVLEFLLASDVFVLASSIESLPVSLLEACSCALPALVSKIGDMPRAVLHGENGFVFNGKDPVLLSVLMAELAENKTLLHQMGKKSRARMEKYYPATEQIYLKIYQELN